MPDGLKITVTVNINTMELLAKFADRTENAQRVLDMAVIADTDPYVPMDTGMLASSVLRSYSTPGLLIYDTPYARRCYYGDYVFKTVHHRLASSHWFEASKQKNLKKWLRDAEKILKGR